MPERLADYFFVATLQVDCMNFPSPPASWLLLPISSIFPICVVDNPESDDVEPIIIDRYPKKDHKNAPFPEDACVVRSSSMLSTSSMIVLL